jgi:FAD/FMN-containing dehydrogenase
MTSLTFTNFLAELQTITDCKITLGQDIDLKYTQDWRGKYQKTPLLMLQPQNTAAVQKIVMLCATYHYKIVVQGGNTSLCGGSIANDDQQVLINLNQMNQIRQYDSISQTVVVEAGCTLQNLQDFAKKQGAFYPLSLPSEKYCTIGGNLSTNAGGVAVLRYGNSRQLCLGLEVVLANGELYQGLYQLNKNNMGYDLKHLFIGAEGTLGIITAATLQFFEAPSKQNVFLFSTQNMQEMIALFKYLKNQFSPLLTGFEIINQSALNCVKNYLTANLPQEMNDHQHDPLLLKIVNHIQIFDKKSDTNTDEKWYALCEITEYPAIQMINNLAQHIQEQNIFENICLLEIKAQSPTTESTICHKKPCTLELTSFSLQSNQKKMIHQSISLDRQSVFENFQPPENHNHLTMHYFWQIRHLIPIAQKFLGGNLKHDVSVKLDDIAGFINQTTHLIQNQYPAVDFILFGHMGDGNIHFNVDTKAYDYKHATNDQKNITDIKQEISRIIHQSIQSFNGSIAAEHGIGQLKKELLKTHVPATHFKLMKALKNLLDPSDLFNKQNLFEE